jgi:hypothetical protein
MRRVAIVVLLASACGARAVEPYEDPASCDLERAVDKAAEDAEPAAIDCGFVVFDDDLPTWEAAHDCTVTALAASDPVQVIWQPQAIDSVPYNAVVGADEITWFSYDDYQGDINFSSQSCSAVEVVADCVIAVGQMCLQCIGRGDPTQICGGA